MKHIELERDLVPALGLGTWMLSGEACREAVSDALQIGYRHIDTAQAYENEEAIGEALAGSGIPRQELFVTTKVWWENLEHGETIQSTEASLHRLRLDYVDMLLIHWPNLDLPLDEPLVAFEKLRQDGKARHLGVSNFTPKLFLEAIERAPIVCNQVEYHPFLGQSELLEICRQRRLLLTAYAPLARGDVLEDPMLQEIGRQHGKSAAQVALRWLLQQDRVAAIPKAARREHRRSNIDVFDFELSSEDMARIHGRDRGQRLIDPDFAPEWSH